jgi:hypothetical protein
MYRLRKKSRKTISFIVASKNKIKHLTKEMKDLYNENDKTFKKETEDTRRWKDIPYS